MPRGGWSPVHDRGNPPGGRARSRRPTAPRAAPSPRPRTACAHRSGSRVVGPLDPRVHTTAARALVVVDRDEQPAARRHRGGRVLERVHISPGVVQHPPRVDDVEGAEPRDVARVERAARSIVQLVAVRREAAPQLLGAGDALRVVVERVDARGAEPARGEPEQPAPAADVEERAPRSVPAPSIARASARPPRSAPRRARRGTGASSRRTRSGSPPRRWRSAWRQPRPATV